MIPTGSICLCLACNSHIPEPYNIYNLIYDHVVHAQTFTVGLCFASLHKKESYHCDSALQERIYVLNVFYNSAT